ncbi:glycosyltransferase [Geodermatophilus normandii]|uniref:Glycosyltransferase family 1 protein n=1 Tax=Geodermatophilus normandii TaxID=1137989 RepID=A0A6P0GHC8_9ACTN|nr:nucleotide disphospho-sugar-binding domain-containing protein [Geodermatophilus normandii]NEM06669.1 glycosyltransferase family 1 protein [Geodermatophilus normandii]NEM08393.1 glycosyltransferase family 1 protein [Geodermatophilus normandii]
MRVLVVASPLTGHVLPLVPLALALRDAGAEVLVATAGDGIASCPPELSPTDVAPGLRLGPLFGRLMLRRPLLARREMAGRGGTTGVGLLFGTLGARMADGVLAAADRHRPDLVVHESLAPTGAEAAARLGVPSVLVEGNLYDAEVLLAAALGTYRPARGLGELPPPARVLTSAPPSVVGTRAGTPVRFVPWTPDRPFDAEFSRPGPRPRVLVSRSTVASPGSDRLMRDVVAAAAGTDLDVVLVRPDRRVARRRLPPPVRTADWLPFPRVVPAAAAVVHHGGAGTVLTALAAGVPQLVVRGAGDRRTNGDLIAIRGAGVAVDPGGITPALLERLVSDPDLAAAARGVAAEIAAMPPPADVVPGLLELAGR